MHRCFNSQMKSRTLLNRQVDDEDKGKERLVKETTAHSCLIISLNPN